MEWSRDMLDPDVYMLSVHLCVVTFCVDFTTFINDLIYRHSDFAQVLFKFEIWFAAGMVRYDVHDKVNNGL